MTEEMMVLYLKAQGLKLRQAARIATNVDDRKTETAGSWPTYGSREIFRPAKDMFAMAEALEVKIEKRKTREMEVLESTHVPGKLEKLEIPRALAPDRPLNVTVPTVNIPEKEGETKNT